ncbi:hypothetical protein R1flu_025725 [Riccia fluitans]|uniref:Uncharacterized protein n=1 Tax=Riccia fluitans TaxID=41844 RepID=A0ABD1XYJ6_9MARC
MSVGRSSTSTRSSSSRRRMIKTNRRRGSQAKRGRETVRCQGCDEAAEVHELIYLYSGIYYKTQTSTSPRRVF